MNITNFTLNKIAYVEIDKNWNRAETKNLSFVTVAASAIPRSRRFATMIYEIVSKQFLIIEYSLRETSGSGTSTRNWIRIGNRIFRTLYKFAWCIWRTSAENVNMLRKRVCTVFLSFMHIHNYNRTHSPYCCWLLHELVTDNYTTVLYVYRFDVERSPFAMLCYECRLY